MFVALVAVLGVGGHLENQTIIDEPDPAGAGPDSCEKWVREACEEVGAVPVRDVHSEGSSCLGECSSSATGYYIVIRVTAEGDNEEAVLSPVED